MYVIYNCLNVLTIIVVIDSDGGMLRVWEDMSVKFAQDPRNDRYHKYIEVTDCVYFHK